MSNDENQGVLLRDFLAGCSASDRAHVQSRLAFLESTTNRHRDAVENLYGERNVVAGVWRPLVKVLRITELRQVDLESSIQRVFSRSILKGPLAKGTPATRLLGRATTLDSVARQGVRAKIYPSVQHARQAIRKYSRTRLSTIQQRWRRRKLGEHAMWGFFQPTVGIAPFQNLPLNRGYVCALLGLPRSAAEEELVCYEYVLPEAVVPKIPRVVEAYAGLPWNCYFRTQQEPDRPLGHGRTRVWDELREKDERGLPEVVHAPITGDYLTSRPVVI